eukprot:Lithocolla_globosa_v1_NODE_2474_length_1987_cov_16.364907.p3 type:complete len:107 gc:universal NODE_2474_length_1987_cov_16.364907:674-354(-)
MKTQRTHARGMPGKFFDEFNLLVRGGCVPSGDGMSSRQQRGIVGTNTQTTYFLALRLPLSQDLRRHHIPYRHRSVCVPGVGDFAAKRKAGQASGVFSVEFEHYVRM